VQLQNKFVLVVVWTSDHKTCFSLLIPCSREMNVCMSNDDRHAGNYYVHVTYRRQQQNLMLRFSRTLRDVRCFNFFAADVEWELIDWRNCKLTPADVVKSLAYKQQLQPAASAASVDYGTEFLLSVDHASRIKISYVVAAYLSSTVMGFNIKNWLYGSKSL